MVEFREFLVKFNQQTSSRSDNSRQYVYAIGFVFVCGRWKVAYLHCGQGYVLTLNGGECNVGTQLCRYLFDLVVAGVSFRVCVFMRNRSIAMLVEINTVSGLFSFKVT